MVAHIKHIVFFLPFYLLCNFTYSQPEEKEPKLFINGYVKSLQGLFDFSLIPQQPRQTLTDNFLHHRLNLDYLISDQLTFKSGLRTRLFFGEFTRIQPDYGNLLSEGGNDVLNMTLINTGQKILLHSIVDRAYLDFTKENIEIRLGRQRINWGINTLWNPNDLFNAYSFTDFDYTERPGSDALRIRYFIGFAGSIEFAIKAFDNSDEIVAAGLYKFNKNNYDYQILAGWSNEDIVLGGGWAGSIKNVGFKGEFSWFNSTNNEVTNAFAITTSFDYSLEDGTYFIGGMLFNSGSSSGTDSNLFAFDLSARNLYPYQWSTFIQTTIPISPLINSGLAFIYSPVESHPIFLSPTLSYSIANNLDIDFVGQLVLQERDNGYGSQANVFYLRMKWSY